jgi:hypothetical protein
MRRYFLLAAVAVVLGALVVSQPPVVADGPEPVTVTNFPEVQRVIVNERTRFESRKAIATPGDLSDASHLTEAGTLETTGFTHVTLSLSGSLQGSAQAGAVGVVLVPDVPEVTAALRNGILQLGLRAEAALSPAQGGYFSSDSVTFHVGFPRYRVLLYNSTSKSADAAVYAYLSTS